MLRYMTGLNLVWKHFTVYHVTSHETSEAVLEETTHFCEILE